MNSFRHLLINQLMSSEDWTGKPSDWSDIRVNCPKKSIALYAAHSADYTSYDNLGFMATCVGGYNVFIDGVQYGSTYASGSTCNITWSTSGITTGDDITTPSALKAHKIWIEPATEGNNITAFHCDRVAASGTEQQGILWAHFNISNSIDATSMFGNTDNSFRQQVLQAITAKNNTLKIDTSASAFVRVCQSLTYLPVIDGQNNNLSNAFQTFADCPSLPNINVKNFASTILHATFRGARALNKLPKGINYSVAVRMVDYLTNAVSLEDTILDVSDATALKAIGCYGTSQYFMSGFKGLRVSSSAPFNYATSPQINVSYTGMDRAALVQLFNDLPSVSAGQIINVTGATGSEDLTADDVIIAINKGWTIIGGPTPVQLYAYTDGNNNTIYAKDENLVGTYKALNTNDFTNNGINIDENGIATISADENTPSVKQGTQPCILSNVINLGSASQEQLSSYAFVIKAKVLNSNYCSFSYMTGTTTWISGYYNYILQAENSYCSTTLKQGYNLTLQTAINNNEFFTAKLYRENSSSQTILSCGVGSDDSSGGSFRDPLTLANDDNQYFRIGPCKNDQDSRVFNCEVDLKGSYYVILGIKKTLAILNTTSTLYNSAFQKITATAENYNNVIVINGVTYTRDTTKDTTAVVPD